MPTVKLYRAGALVRETTAETGQTLHSVINNEGEFLDAPCGGKGRCRKCLVRLSPDGEEVLACQTEVRGDTSIFLPAILDMEIAGQDKGNTEAVPVSHGRLGVAVDIGTTTVVAHLTDLDSGRRLATASGVNAQRAFGADVISRIQYCAISGHGTLTKLIRGQLRDLFAEACLRAGAQPAEIEFVSIAGNTIMEHLAANLSPVGMGVVPFAPLSLFGETLPAGDDLGVSRNAEIYFAPAIHSYVGGDITAGMLAADLEHNPETLVYIDIGTNGEIAMKTGDRYYCCATAAGPAFEGAEISKGMAAVPGAISHVKWTDALEYVVIGEGKPAGLCGSGLLDALALLVETGAVDEGGRLLPPEEVEHPIRRQLQNCGKYNRFILSEEYDVSMDSADVRKLQLAKSAIAAGILTLLSSAGVEPNDVKSFYLCGGFGSYMDQNSAAAIGLFPKTFLSVTRTMGNTAGEGAAIALCSGQARATLAAMRDRCEYIELSTSPVFNDEFINQMMFENP